MHRYYKILEFFVPNMVQIRLPDLGLGVLQHIKKKNSLF